MSAIQLNADTFRTQVLEQKQPALVLVFKFFSASQQSMRSI